MKVQVNKGNNNKQVSSDPNTVQVQVGTGTVVVVAMLAFLALAGGVLLYLMIN